MFAVQAPQIAKCFGSTRAAGMFRAQVLLTGRPFTAWRFLAALAGRASCHLQELRPDDAIGEPGPHGSGRMR
jgi:hypothetical protein